MRKNTAAAGIIRFAKGIFIGTGFILPGVSGGALAAIFGLYGRMISFLAHLNFEFKKNVLYFLPVGLGMLTGIVLLAYPLDFFLEHQLGPTMWFFIGAILGTFPSLWKEAGKKGRRPKHVCILLAAFCASLVLLLFCAPLMGHMPQNFATWAFAGAIIAFGVLVPGLSPSNFLLYMGMYSAMVEAFKNLDMTVLVPIGVGGLLCTLLFSKLVDMLFRIAYATLFHFILGVVLASTVIIVPLNYSYQGWGIPVCVIVCALGVLLGHWMSGLEEKNKPAKGA